MKLVMDTTVQNPDTLQWSGFEAGTEKSDLPEWAQTAITNPYAYDDRVRDERIDLVCQRLLMHGAPDAMVNEVRDSLEAKVADDDEAVVEALQVSQDAAAVRQAIAEYVGVPASDTATGPDGTTLNVPLYTVDEGTVVDGERWHNAGLVTPDGEPLYTFSEDVAGEPARGDDGVWHLYEGPTEEPQHVDPSTVGAIAGTDHELAPQVETAPVEGDFTPRVETTKPKSKR